MKRLFTILTLALFGLISCSENRSKVKKAEAMTTDTASEKLENSSEKENQITYIKEFDLFMLRDLEGSLHRKVAFIGSSVAPFNYQWTGKLFKNRPEVVFGFEWYSFGCEDINFINSSNRYVATNCDNRH